MKMRIVLVLVAVAMIAFGALSFSRARTGALARAEFSVQNLSCGSCVSNIQGALSGVKGVGEVEVSVTAGRALVEFDPARIEAETIAGHIAEAGYPAAVSQFLSVEDYRSLREDEGRLAARFVGRVGERLISREVFAEALSRQETAGPVPRQGLLRAVWQNLVQRELLLTAAEKNGVVVQDGEVDLELERFDAAVIARYGGEAAFRKLLKEEMIINRNIEEHVLKAEGGGPPRQLLVERWYRELAAGTPVTVFDLALRAAVEGGSGCGGSCCG